MNRIEIRNRKKIEKRENFTEKAGMFIIGIIFLLVIAFLAFTPLVYTGYIIVIGEFFSLKGIVSTLCVFIVGWGWFCVIILELFGR
ncbi:MAG: hypothetical protein ABS916_09570 [Carnobacterium sp.]|uniref:hypothetical protein n=1 Tax=Carnobacterium sp. TaxID=48221 RepID=UPI0033151CA1